MMKVSPGTLQPFHPGTGATSSLDGTESGLVHAGAVGQCRGIAQDGYGCSDFS